MRILEDNIIPYVGTDTFRLGDNLEKIRLYLKENKISFNQSIELNKGCKPEIPWIIIKIADSITLCFAGNVLFEIVAENDYLGKLLNGGCVGMTLSELKTIDPSLIYNDEDEDYISEKGYWIENDIETDEIISISVFLPEVETRDFYSYEWIKKYDSTDSFQ